MWLAPGRMLHAPNRRRLYRSGSRMLRLRRRVLRKHRLLLRAHRNPQCPATVDCFGSRALRSLSLVCRHSDGRKPVVGRARRQRSRGKATQQSQDRMTPKTDSQLAPKHHYDAGGHYRVPGPEHRWRNCGQSTAAPDGTAVAPVRSWPWASRIMRVSCRCRRRMGVSRDRPSPSSALVPALCRHACRS